eukprot:CAMPEP_0203911244 /NCGR_PEP_ID=MMETSP0359-20131031/52426_1 /ASSEMBLY_ACC=CAM_ASM_000338 /TAXON_ID=268821 /ORGANISM="Scrippsiella Hangoei, Strain SHTV-5" /LENGTH=39 /DNA_ID= /DNA_START= /DNA_END= /DNA_ORIENTATION=
MQARGPTIRADTSQQKQALRWCLKLKKHARIRGCRAGVA